MTTSKPPKRQVPVIRGEQITTADEDEVDFVLDKPEFFGSHIGSIPMQSSVHAPRLFYGARFLTQAMPTVNREAPWVQNLKDEDTDESYDDYLGRFSGAVRADDDGVVEAVKPGLLVWRTAKGEQRKIPFHVDYHLNRKSSLLQTPTVKPGDKVTKGSALLTSNFTDGNGTLALGMNARTGLVAYKGHSQDDAIVLREGFAQRMASQATKTFVQDFEDDIKGGLSHFTAVVPTRFTQDQLKVMGEDGVVKKGTILKTGDPIILATRPKAMSSLSAHVGKISSGVRQSRSDASQVWEQEDDAEVVDVERTRSGIKVVTRSINPLRDGDKVVFRSGAKGITAKLIPDHLMPRTEDGQPLDVLYNQLGIISRANASLPYELLVGEVAKKTGKPIKLPAFLKPGEKWVDKVEALLKEHGIPDRQRVYDPGTDSWLEQPITVGQGYLLKLHHTAEGKSTARGSGMGYDQNLMPVKGGESGAKRASGLEMAALMSAGGTANAKEIITIRGQKSDEFWKALRTGAALPRPGKPFVWHKFLAMLSNAGMRTKEVAPGVLRLGPMTDSDVSALAPVEIQNGGLVDPGSLEPTPGGLFDASLVQGNRWGVIGLPRPVINPAFEDTVRAVLGLKRAELRAILAGKMDINKKPIVSDQ